MSTPDKKLVARAKNREAVARYRAKSPDKVKVRSAKYRVENREKLRKAQADRRVRNPGKAAEYNRNYRKENPEKFAESQRKYRENHPEQYKANQRKHKYGISGEDWQALREAQEFRCAGCRIHESELVGQKKQFCIDHDHKTNKVRGLLCHKCNVVLGMVGESRETLENLVDYLEEHS